MSTLRIGAKLPNSGPLPQTLGIPAMARSLEQAGFDSLWVSDHIVLPTSMDSRYPFAADGRATWPSDLPYVEALVALALAAAVTERVTLGSAVIVLPLRNPVLFAKQVASIAGTVGGRFKLGVGAGWLKEEFDALDVTFADRGPRLEEWIGLVRDCWSGRPAGHSSERYTLPEGVLVMPPPPAAIPILMGGHSPAALARGGRVTDGWLAQQTLGELDPGELAAALATMREAAGAAGRDPAALEVVLRIVGSTGRADELAPQLPALIEAGVGEIIVDTSWDTDDLARQCDVLPRGRGLTMELGRPLAGRTALVTGGANGIGLAVARLLAAAGATGIVLDLRAPADDALPDGWSADEVDVGDDASVAAAVERAVSVIGGVDVLILAAGIVPPWRGLTGFDADEWDTVMRVNVLGVASVLAHAQAHLQAGSAVVAIASLNAWRGDANIPSYAASKHAVLGIVRSAALELGRRNVRVNAVAPGPIATDALLARMATRASERGTSVPDALSAAAELTALGRIATVDEVARVVLFLASDLSSGVTGQMIPVDGGLG